MFALIFLISLLCFFFVYPKEDLNLYDKISTKLKFVLSTNFSTRIGVFPQIEGKPPYYASIAPRLVRSREFPRIIIVLFQLGLLDQVYINLKTPFRCLF